MDSLIKIDGLGKAIEKLTDKLSVAVGWVANRETPKKVARETWIKEIQEGDFDPLTKSALISNANQIIKEFSNQNDIVEIAYQNLQPDALPEQVEDDWINQFMNKAKLVSSEEFQLIWGEILARECNQPGSIPLVLLHTLEKMDKEDAASFTALTRISVKLEKEYVPIFIASKEEDYQSLVGITYDKLVALNALGLIEMDFTASTVHRMRAEKMPAKVVYFEKEYELDEENLIVGNIIYTKSGQALCQTLYQSIQVEAIDGFWENYCIPFWEKCKQRKNQSNIY